MMVIGAREEEEVGEEGRKGKEGGKGGEKERRRGGGRVGVQNSTKEYKRIQKKKTATVLLNLTKLSVWLHFYCNIYLIETRGQQSGRLLPTHPSLQPKMAGRGSYTI